jgi:hypothetical protein
MKSCLSVLCVITFALLCCVECFACTCPRENLPGTEAPLPDINKVEAVFSGEVTDIRMAGRKWLSITIKVEQSWRGEIPEAVTIFTSRNTCGYVFTKGESYLVYANTYPSGNGFTTDTCKGNKKLIDAKRNLEALGVGKTIGK